MPIYDYSCDDCGAIFEKRRSMRDTGPVVCAECGAHDTTKLMSAPCSVIAWRDSDSVHLAQRFRSAVPNRQIQAIGGTDGTR